MKTKRLLSLILAIAMMLSFTAFSVNADNDASVTITDIDSTSDVGKAVNRLVAMGIINGYPDGTYRPDITITRAEFSVVMVKFLAMQDYINPDALTGFEDLDTDENYAWARPYVAMAVQRKIINGFEDKTFRAADPVTYEQAIKMLVCALGYEKQAQAPTIAGDWSSGYIAKAIQLRLTKGTSITNKTKSTTRGVVAMLVNNAVDAQSSDIVSSNGDVIMSGEVQSDLLGYTNVKGIVTGTYITELEDQVSEVPKDHIMIDEDIYEIGFSTDPNEFLGCEVQAVVKKNDEGDYPIATSLTVTNKNNVLEIDADFVGSCDGSVLEYQTKRDGAWKEARLVDEPIIIYNNKYVDAYDLSNIGDELVSGNVVLVDNNGDKKYDIVRINSYSVFVVTSKNTTAQSITLMYDAKYEGSSKVFFPEDSTSLVFSLTRNGKAITFSDIAKWDVLNIKASPEDARGRRYYQVIVTRDTVSGVVTEVDSDDKNCVVIGGAEYYIADSYMNYKGDDKVDISVGDSVQVYFDANKKIVGAAKTTAGANSDEAYAYLFGVRQGYEKSDYDLEFWIYTTAGKEITIGAANNITIDGVRRKATDKNILKYLEQTAVSANKEYPDARNINYRQPIIYQTNASGLVSTIYTVSSEENSGISNSMNDENTKTQYFVPYEKREYRSTSKTFTDFKVSSATKIIYVPDNRAATDDYLVFRSYSSAFANGRDYHVEAYGLTSSKTAALVLIYKENDTIIYTSASPWMIVASTSETKNGTIIKGYVGSSMSLKEIIVDEDNGPSIEDVGKGDVIRYLVNSAGHLIDYQVWFDASNPQQLESCSSKSDAIKLRTLEIHNTSTEPRENLPSAAFRLQFGTVTEIVFGNEHDSIDDYEETITVAPTIAEDSIAMVYDGDGVVSRTIGSSVNVFSYDATARNSTVSKLTREDLSEILDYANYGDDATRVITYSSGGTLRMIYIVTVD